MPRWSDSVGLGRGREFACLTGSQVMLMPVVQGSHFEKHQCRECVHWGLQNKTFVWFGIWYFTGFGRSSDGVYQVDGTQSRINQYWMQRAQLIGRNVMSVVQGVDWQIQGACVWMEEKNMGRKKETWEVPCFRCWKEQRCKKAQAEVKCFREYCPLENMGKR